MLGYANAKNVLGQNLGEEEKTDKLLTQLSSKINQSANVGRSVSPN